MSMQLCGLYLPSILHFLQSVVMERSSASEFRVALLIFQQLSKNDGICDKILLDGLIVHHTLLHTI